jgi:glycosyltransferase involved in cell wall biosynthesis
VDKVYSPAISIGMPVYNCETTIAVSVQSILNQAFTDWELIVIDDGSKDGTLAVAKEFHDPRIRIVDGKENLGLPTRLNQAVHLSRGKYFARMDGDDIAYPERLEKQLDFLRDNGDVDLLATAVVIFKDDGTLLGCRPTPVSHDEICAHPQTGFPMAHPTWMGPIDWFRRNPYRTDAIRMEDKELLFRTHACSKFACLNETLLAYRENSLSASKLRVARINFIRVLARNEGKVCSTPAVLCGIFGQLARAVLDFVAISTGLTYTLLRHRARPISVLQAKRWSEVWKQTSASPTV